MAGVDAGAAASPAYRLTGVELGHKGRRVLEIDALEIPSGRVTAVTGANGTGKSTLLRALAFLHRPDAGSLAFRGETVEYRRSELTALRRRVTYVAQAPLLFRRSVRANVAYGLRQRGAPENGRVREALRAVDLAGFEERNAARLSGGETQRVALARALAIDPACYLLDEPTANLDRAIVPRIESLIRALAAAGRTVVLATHDLEQAWRLGDGVLRIEAGRLSALLAPNVLRGITRSAGGQWYFETQGLRIELPEESATQAITIAAEDLIVSRRPLESSARNCLRGQILEIVRDREGVLLTVDCGAPLRARITEHSFAEMSLAVGAVVYVTFKSSALRRHR